VIENQKDLEKLLKLCRKQGVTELVLPTVSFKLGELPVKHPTESIEDQEDIFTDFPDGELSAEELTYFANGGKPQDNPYRRINENN
jgi:hypothetical protein